MEIFTQNKEGDTPCRKQGNNLSRVTSSSLKPVLYLSLRRVCGYAFRWKIFINIYEVLVHI